MTSKPNLKARLQFLEKEILILQSQLSNALPGTIFSRKKPNGTYRYYRRIILPDGTSKEFYLGIQNHEEAVQLAEKMALEKRLLDYQKERWLVQRILSFQEREPDIDRFLRNHPGISALLREREIFSKDDAEQWKNTPYPRNMNYPESLKYTTVVPGLLVRSKSEAMIVSALENYGVPYHYDEMVTFGNETLSMDFVCMNKRVRSIYYWDHRGMMTNPEYIKKTLFCDKIFLENGYIPWINMIITTETYDHPLDVQWVNTIIEHYLL